VSSVARTSDPQGCRVRFGRCRHRLPGPDRPHPQGGSQRDSEPAHNQVDTCRRSRQDQPADTLLFPLAKAALMRWAAFALPATLKTLALQAPARRGTRVLVGRSR
jgi:hypothetical protein